jgi:peptide/nickel transport system substrate-binding protein
VDPSLHRLPWALLLGLALAALLACAPRDRTELRFALATAPVTLDPRFATDALSSRLVRLLYRAPVDFDVESRPVPALARWRALTPTRYRLTLGAAGRRFHDGTVLTARDVKATYDSVLDRASGSPHRASLGAVSAVEALDDDTLDFHLREADPLFAGRLTIGVLPARLLALGHPFGQRPIGSGPFALVGWPEEGRLTLRRLADSQDITLLRVADPTMRVLKLLGGEVDMTQGDLPPELVAWLAGRPGIQVQRGSGSTFTYLGFNLADPVTGGLAVRRAVALALDRAAIGRSLLQGTVRPAASILPPEHWAGYRGEPGITHDPDRARALLGELGYGPERPLPLTLVTSSDPLRTRIAAVVQHQLRQVGIRLAVRSFDWATFYADVKAGRFQTYLLSWVAIRTPDIFRHAFHSRALPPAGANRGRYADPVVDDLIERAERATGEDEQAELFRAVQARLLETLPYVPLWYEEPVFVARDGVSGYRVSADGGYDGLEGVNRGGEGSSDAHGR